MKIIDTFVFYNELDLLEIRLAILDEVVDCFVLVEATRTFQNNPKPLFFEENKERFSKYLNKIRHVVVDDFPEYMNPFDIELHQRNAIVRGLEGFDDCDQIIVSDVDEIPDPSCVKYAAEIPDIKAFRQQLYYYFLNCECAELNDLPWSIMCNLGEMESPQVLRDRIVNIQGALLSGIYHVEQGVKLIENAGWHFSYLGGVEAIKNKIRSYSHVEYNNQDILDDEKIMTVINEGNDLFGRGFHFNYVAIDESFPDYILKNKERYKHLLNQG